jgi:nondiscriminating glutamyl-tRNA synthetase
MKNVRVRFAPSPTGNLHIGATRVALFNYVYAKKEKGEFILRIEDTDKERSTKEYEDNIMRSLEWLGVSWDEGPYYQSERIDLYKKYVKKLLDEKKAYHCFCTKEDLEKMREAQREKKEPPRYEGKCNLLSEEDVVKKLNSKCDFTIRLKIPEDKELEFNDLIKGRVKFNTKDIGGDFVIAKSDFSALYNFVCVVDDYEMKITHVIRGEDHISNTPKQILIYNALEIDLPKFAHLSMLLGSDKSKLSKRHGATSINDYKEEGYLKEAMINFMAFLGWHPKGEKELYSIEEITKEFSLEDCQKSNAIFDYQKLDYLNSLYIRKMEKEIFTRECIPYLVKNGLITADFKEEQYPPAYGGKLPKNVFYLDGKEISFEKISEIVSLYKERVKKLSEITEHVGYLFKDDLEYEVGLLLWKDAKKEETISELEKAINVIANIKEWSFSVVEESLLQEAEKSSNRGVFLWPVRVALSGKKASASPFEIIWVLGPEKSIKRLKMAINRLKSQCFC